MFCIKTKMWLSVPLIYIQEHGDKVNTLQSSPVLTKITTNVKRNESNADDGGTNLIKVLELTERELFDCKVQLETKVRLFSKVSNHCSG